MGLLITNHMCHNRIKQYSSPLPASKENEHFTQHMKCINSIELSNPWPDLDGDTPGAPTPSNFFPNTNSYYILSGVLEFKI